MTAPELIASLDLLPHPEGGYYREVYRSPESTAHDALPERFSGPRSFCTSIYFLLEGKQVSHFHRIKSDELWYFHAGSPIVIHQLSKPGYTATVLGESEFQLVVPAGTWFGAEVQDGEGFSLVGCAVCPGFDFADFEMAKRQELLAEFPGHCELIERLT